MPDDRLIRCEINPLAFLEADEPWASSTTEKPTSDEVLRFLCPPDERFSFDIERLLTRYKQISTEPVRLFAAPDEQRILDKLIWPLRSAKSSFMVGSYLATVSLSGMVAEMVAVLLWQLAGVAISHQPINKEGEELLLGREFEKLGQERRVSVLSAFGVIDAKTKMNFDTIRCVRRHYLHLFSKDHDRLPEDGIRCFHAAVALVVTLLGQDVQDGKLVMNPRLLHYLDQQQNPSESPQV
ncbi:MAG: hypothetical protein ACLQG3_03385 [Terracidiphilus sp.]